MPNELLDQQIIELCRNGNKLEAIKLHRQSTNVTLKQSKDYVERLATENGIEMATGKHACFIATACYGDYDAHEVLLLRNYRDEKLLPTRAGRIFVKVYYTISPPIAKVLERSAVLRNFTRKYILSFLVNTLQKKTKRN